MAYRAHMPTKLVRWSPRDQDHAKILHLPFDLMKMHLILVNLWDLTESKFVNRQLYVMIDAYIYIYI